MYANGEVQNGQGSFRRYTLLSLAFATHTSLFVLQQQPDGMSQGGGIDGQEVLRHEDPHYNTWKVTNLRAKALEITKSDGAKALVFGPDPEEGCTASLSSATKTAHVQALPNRAPWRESTGRPQDYQHWGPITPQKAAKAIARPSQHTGVRKEAASVFRMVCLMADAKLLDLFMTRQTRNQTAASKMPEKLERSTGCIRSWL